MSSDQKPGWVGALFVGLSIFSLGQAVQFSNGTLSPPALKALTVSLVCLALGIATSKITRGERKWTWAVLRALAGVATVYQLFQLGGWSPPPAMYIRTVEGFAGRLVIFTALTFAMIAARGRVALVLAVPWLGSFWYLGAWVIAASPSPNIDVWVWTHHALSGMAKGLNPYTMEMPNIYGHTKWYAAGIADAQTVHIGYTYMPLSLEISWLGWVFGDMRWANIVFYVIAGVGMALCRKSLSLAAAALLLTTPRMTFIIEQAWNDSYCLGIFALLIAAALRWPKLVPYALGLLLAVKQYSILLIPLFILLVPRPWTLKTLWGFSWRIIVAGVVVTLPFFVLNPVAMFKDVAVGVGVPFRPEALSYMAATAVNEQPSFPTWLQFPLLIPVYALTWFLAPRNAVGFALGSALTFGVFFAFSRHAFCNHYFFVFAMAAVGLATFGNDERGDAAAAPKPQAPLPN